MLNFANKTWVRWKNIAHYIGVFQTKVILTVFYFTVLFPAGIIISLFKDKLNIKTVLQITWIVKDKQAETLKEMRKQH